MAQRARPRRRAHLPRQRQARRDRPRARPARERPLEGGARHLKKSRPYLGAAPPLRYLCIETLSSHHAVRTLCRVLKVSVSGFYAWRKRGLSRREQQNRQLKQQIEAVFVASKQAYGSPRVYRTLVRQGVCCSENRVARLMREQGLQAKKGRRRRRTTIGVPT